MTQRLVLEPLRVEHAAEMALTLDDVRLHEFTGGEPATRAELSARYRRQVVGRSSRRQAAVARTGCSAAATTVARRATSRPPWSTTLPTANPASWPSSPGWSRPDTSDRGWPAKAATAVTRWLAGQGVQRLVAHVHPDNTASAAIARSLGMAPTEVVVDGEVRWTGPAQSSGSRSAISAAS